MITLLVDPAALAAPRLTVRGAAYRHLFRARRAAAGERVRAVDGRGAARWGEIVAVGRDEGTIALGAEAPPNEPARRLDLFVAAPRAERAAWLVEKATEVGVAAIHFVACERAPRALGPAAIARLERVAGAALEQCHRARLPEISGPLAWRELPVRLTPLAVRHVLDPAAASGQQAPSVEPAALLVGPEGGFTESELTELRAWGCVPLGLGPRTLRIETAAVVGAALLLLAS